MSETIENKTTGTMKSGTIGDKLPDNKTPDMAEKKYIPLEEAVDKYSAELPPDMQSFYRTLPQPYHAMLAQVYTAYKAVGMPNPEREAIKIMGAMIGAELIDFAERQEKGYNYKQAARTAATEIMQNLGYHSTDIEKYFPTNETKR